MTKRNRPPASFAGQFDAAVDAYRSGNAHLSLEHFRRCVELSPDRWDVLQHMAAVHAEITGDVAESVRLLRCARRLRKRLQNPAAPPPPYCFLQDPWASELPGIATIERLVKRETLAGRDSKNIVLYTAKREHALLAKLAAYITVVADERELPHPLEAMLSVLEDDSLCESLDGVEKHPWHAAAEIARAWESAGREPLLRFSQGELDRGAAYLRKLGVPEGAWFVSVLPGADEVTSYAPALEAIAKRGGSVVHLGADHALRPDAGDALDIFMLGACRFFIGGRTDFAGVPGLFGTPSVLTNWASGGHQPANSGDIYLPKLYNAGAPRRPLTFGEIMAPPLGYASRYEHAAVRGLACVPNTAEEICEAVEEMLDRLEGALRYNANDEALLSAFDAVAQANLCLGGARPGRGFLRRHASLLMNVSIF